MWGQKKGLRQTIPPPAPSRGHLPWFCPPPLHTVRIDFYGKPPLKKYRNKTKQQRHTKQKNAINTFLTPTPSTTNGGAPGPPPGLFVRRPASPKLGSGRSIFAVSAAWAARGRSERLWPLVRVVKVLSLHWKTKAPFKLVAQQFRVAQHPSDVVLWIQLPTKGRSSAPSPTPPHPPDHPCTPAPPFARHSHVPRTSPPPH